jgi:hypothetical protein
MMNGLAVAYTFPWVLSGLTLFANRISITPWNLKNIKYLWPNDYNADWVGDVSSEDQKITVGARWLFTKIGAEVYCDLMWDDYSDLIRRPWDGMTYSLGLKKALIFTDKIRGEITLEFLNMEVSRCNLLQDASYMIYQHGHDQGYTNAGQWLGAGSGWGGNSQYISFTLYYPKGNTDLFFQRANTDDNYIWRRVPASHDEWENLRSSFQTDINIGIKSTYYIFKDFNINGGIVYNKIVSPYYDTRPSGGTSINNFSISLGMGYSF